MRGWWTSRPRSERYLHSHTAAPSATSRQTTASRTCTGCASITSAACLSASLVASSFKSGDMRTPFNELVVAAGLVTYVFMPREFEILSKGEKLFAFLTKKKIETWLHPITKHLSYLGVSPKYKKCLWKST